TMPSPSSSSPFEASGTSATRTPWTRSLTLQLLVPALAALGGMLLFVAPYSALTLERSQTDALAERLLAEARSAGEVLPWTAGAELEAECTRIAVRLGVRLTLIGGDGRLLCDSKRPTDSLDAPATRPEVIGALAAGSGRSVRMSSDGRQLYV